jgi:hypothetical protein
MPVRRSQAAEIDDPSHTGRRRRPSEIHRAPKISLSEASTGSHTVDKVVGGGNALQGGEQGLIVEDVSGDDLDVFGPRAAGHAVRISDQGPRVVACLGQALDQPAADIARRSGYERSS